MKTACLQLLRKNSPTFNYQLGQAGCQDSLDGCIQCGEIIGEVIMENRQAGTGKQDS